MRIDRYASIDMAYDESALIVALAELLGMELCDSLLVKHMALGPAVYTCYSRNPCNILKLINVRRIDGEHRLPILRPQLISHHHAKLCRMVAPAFVITGIFIKSSVDTHYAFLLRVCASSASYEYIYIVYINPVGGEEIHDHLPSHRKLVADCLIGKQLRRIVEYAVGEYILPVKITEADADEISPGKEYTLISLSYQGRQFGNYTYTGKATGSDGQTIEYTNQPTATNSIRQLQTVAADKFRVYADQNGTSDPMKGKYSMLVSVPVKGGGPVTLESDPDFLPDIEVSQNGECTYDEASKTFVLRYKYTDAAGVEWKCEDTMVFRNRVRNDQGDGRVLYEWRGF